MNAPHTGIWVVVTRYAPPLGHPIVNVYGPYASVGRARTVRRQMERQWDVGDPRAALIEYRVRELVPAEFS